MSHNPPRSLAIAGMIAGIGLLAGCAPWPPYGLGGLAENHAPNWGGRYVATETARLISIKERIDMLGQLGGRTHYPAAMEDIRLAYIRAARSHGGGMEADLAAQLTELEAELEVQTRRLTHRARNQLPPTPAECSL